MARVIYRYLVDPARKEVRNEFGADPTDEKGTRDHLLQVFTPAEDFA